MSEPSSPEIINNSSDKNPFRKFIDRISNKQTNINQGSDKSSSVLPDGVSESSHTEESKRMITENIYNCWNELPINSGTVSLELSYQKPTEELINAYENGLSKDTSFIVTENSNGGCQVRLEIPLSKINIPEKMPIGYINNFDATLKLVQFYESLNVPLDVMLPSLKRLTSVQSGYLISMIKEIKEHNPNAPFVDISDKDLFPYLMDQTQFLLNQYSKSTLDKTSTILKQLKDSILSYSGLNPNLKFNKTLSGGNHKFDNIDDLFENETFAENFYDETCLTPCPAIYHDNIVDSRFRDGYIKSNIVMGTLISDDSDVHDVDFSAANELYKKIHSQLIGARDKTLYCPPNMTNLFIINMPIVTEEIYNVHKTLKPDSSLSSLFVPLLLCDTPTRMNPVVISEIYSKLAIGRGFLVTKSSDDTLQRLIMKDNKEWKISSTKPRLNIPWNYKPPKMSL